MLRDTPARRITFRRGDALVGKYKHRHTLARSYAVLRSVHAATRHGELVVPEPIGIDMERGVFYQRCVAGRSIQELIEPGNAAELTRAFGSLHAAIPARRRSATATRRSTMCCATATRKRLWTSTTRTSVTGTRTAHR